MSTNIISPRQSSRNTGTIQRFGVSFSADFISVQRVCIWRFASSERFTNIVVFSSR